VIFIDDNEEIVLHCNGRKRMSQLNLTHLMVRLAYEIWRKTK